MKIKDINQTNWKLKYEDDIIDLETLEKLPSGMKKKILDSEIVHKIDIDGFAYYETTKTTDQSFKDVLETFKENLNNDEYDEYFEDENSYSLPARILLNILIAVAKVILNLLSLFLVLVSVIASYFAVLTVFICGFLNILAVCGILMFLFFLINPTEGIDTFLFFYTAVGFIISSVLFGLVGEGFPSILAGAGGFLKAISGKIKFKKKKKN